MTDWIAWFKVFMTAVGVGLVSAAQTVEPSEAVWIMSCAGGLLGVALGEDKSIATILAHVFLGVVVALAVAAIGEVALHLPRPPVALFGGLFAARATVAVNKEIDTGNFSVIPKWFRRG